MCNGGATRAEMVTRFVRRTNIPSIFGGTVRFSQEGDPMPARFIVFKVTNGKYSSRLVGPPFEAARPLEGRAASS